MIRIGIAADASADGADPFLIRWQASSEALRQASERASEVCRAIVASVIDGTDAAAEAAVETYKARLKRLGRDPNRYRISSDALIRRIRKDRAFPRIVAPVDVNNAVSVRTGWPVGCYDADALHPPVVLRHGLDRETMSTLSKGEFPLHGLPVLADEAGAFGSPISDSTRARIGDGTQMVVFVLYGYGDMQIEPTKRQVEQVVADLRLDLSGDVNVVGRRA